MELIVSLVVIITTVVCLSLYLLRDLKVITDGIGTMLAPALFVLAAICGYGFIFFGGEEEAKYIVLLVVFIVEGICFFINAGLLDQYYNANREAVLLFEIIGMALLVPSVIRLICVL